MDVLAQLQLAVARLSESAGSRRQDLVRFGSAIGRLEARIGPDVAAVVPSPRVVLRPDPVRPPDIAGVVPHDSATPEVASRGPWNPSWP